MVKQLTQTRKATALAIVMLTLSGCGAAVQGFAGAAAQSPASGAYARQATPPTQTSGSSETPAANSATSASVDGALNTIDNQLSTLDSEISQAGTGINTTEGDPSQ
jgi:hypothetical protein